MPKRYFIASGCPIATTSQYRCVHLREQLQLLGHQTTLVEWFRNESIEVETALQHDVIVLYRLPICPALRRLIDKAAAAEKLILFDTDDLIFAPELIQWHRGVRRLSEEEQGSYAEGVQRYLATLQACDAVITATPLLARLAQEKSQRAFVHRNALGNEMLSLSERLARDRANLRTQGKVVIGYGSGTPTHDVDFEEVALSLVEIMASYVQVELWIAGPLSLSSSLEQFGARLRRFPLTNWQGWFELQSKMDIALAPLELNNVFCRAKSEIKFVESGAVGVPLIASRTEPFQDVMQDGVSGFLAMDKSEWMAALAKLIEGPTLRRQIGERARQVVLESYSPQARTRDLCSLLQNLTNGQVAVP